MPERSDIEEHMKWKRYERMPECSDCGQKVQTECYYKIEGKVICEDCLSQYRYWTEDIE